MAEEATIWFIWSPVRCYLYILWQPELCKVVRESSIPWQVKAFWDQVSLYQEYGAEGSSEALVCCDRGTDSWCVDEAIIQSEVQVLQGEAWFSPYRGPFQGEVTSPIAILTSRSNIRVEPFCHGERIWFLPCQMWVLAILTSRSDVRATAILTSRSSVREEPFCHG